MARAAVYAALKNNPTLQAMNVKVFPNYALDRPPSRQYPFLILRWEEQVPRIGVRRGPTVLTVWAHCPTSYSTDYSVVDALLNVVDNVLTTMEHVDGNDGQTVTEIRWTGRGSDMKDPGYETITKTSAFEVLYRATV